MSEEKAGPHEVVVYGVLLLVFFNLGTIAVSVSVMDVSGRHIPPHPALAIMAGVGALVALAATFALAVRYFGTKQGIKLVLSNFAAGALIVSGASAAVAFILRFIFGPAAPAILLIAWGAIIYGTLAIARKRGPL